MNRSRSGAKPDAETGMKMSQTSRGYTIMPVALAVNVVVITSVSATVIDNRYASAPTTRGECWTRVGPGASRPGRPLLGIPGGIGAPAAAGPDAAPIPTPRFHVPDLAMRDREHALLKAASLTTVSVAGTRYELIAWDRG